MVAAPKAKKHTVPKRSKKLESGKTSKKKKKQTIKYNLECKNPVEDGIMNVNDFGTFLNERIKVNGKVGNMAANGVKLEITKTKIILTSEVNFYESVFNL
ncbi:ribosomal L22e protein [Onchocerca flexuosa]|uniref:Large ribosomal subunit protein eL22 n=1 Tax=Onchocerca flexuosa TaxID=387005 RepID=A0A238BMW1_9BILA|nr:ribosomal L22e protein [Onchocerca flexuosa]